MGKGSPSNRSVFDFKPGTLQVDKSNDGVLGQPLSTAPANASPFSTLGSAASNGLSKGGRREAFVSAGAMPMQAPQPTAFVSVGAAPVQAPQPIQATEPAQTNITVNTPMETDSVIQQASPTPFLQESLNLSLGGPI